MKRSWRVSSPGGRVEQAVDAGPAVDDEPAAHPEVQAQHHVGLVAGDAGVEQQELASPAGRQELPAHERRRRLGAPGPA